MPGALGQGGASVNEGYDNIATGVTNNPSKQAVDQYCRNLNQPIKGQEGINKLNFLFKELLCIHYTFIVRNNSGFSICYIPIGFHLVYIGYLYIKANIQG